MPMGDPFVGDANGPYSGADAVVEPGPEMQAQLDRIEFMLIRLTHVLTFHNGYSGEYTCSCSCGWKGQGWRYRGPDSGDSRIGPEAEFVAHLKSLLPERTTNASTPHDPDS